jgi:hypothetical protein
MALYEITDGGLKQRPAAGFAALRLRERGDLQRLLRDDVSALGDDLVVISEEFGQWEDARRRIDLLALDKSGRLVVIELKRTESGGHMDLQAIRYAAMVSSMDFEDVVAAYGRHLARHGSDGDRDARGKLEQFLEVGEDDEEPAISTEVRIILAGADFGREITTTVLWLNGFEGIDIRCVRVVPYDIGGRILLDVQQILPLPEAADYQVRIRRKEAARERALRDGRDFTRFHVVVDGEPLPAENKRNSMRLMVQHLVDRGAPLSRVYETISRRMKVLPGEFHDPAAVREALSTLEPGIQLNRWFTDSPFVDGDAGRTYVLSNQWGRKTEQRLQDLADAFPETKVTFRRADAEGDAGND